MRIQSGYLFLIWLVLLSGCCGRPDGPTEKDHDAARAVRAIDIYYQYMGWGFRRDHYHIEMGRGGAVSRSWFEVPNAPAHEREAGPVERLDFEAVAEFVRYANSPSIGKTEGTSAFFQTVSMKGADTEIGTVMGYSSACRERVMREYLRLLHDREHVRKALYRNYEREIMWTDDYPHMRILVSHQDGSTMTLESHAQAALMLPWRRNGVETWDYRLADAIAHLLPEERMSRQFYQTPRARFSRDELVDKAARYIEHGVWNDEFSRPRLCKGV